MIYAVRAIGTEYIKFGKAIHIGRRLQGLEVGCPHELEILAAADWEDDTEGIVHWAIEKHHHKGEWYKDSERTQLVLKLMRENKLDAIKAIVAKDAKRDVDCRTTQTPFLACAREGKDWPILPAFQIAAVDAWAAVMREMYGAAARAETP